MIRIKLDVNWEFKQRQPALPLMQDFSAGEWLPATVPGTVHQDLINAGKIPDPFYGIRLPAF
jgi:beta-mannosidase